MPPKPGNAFAQQKELQRRQQQIEDLPETPMTTMSLFLDPIPSDSEEDELAQLKTLTPGLTTNRSDIHKIRAGKRSFTDPGASPALLASFTSDTPSTGKQQGGLSYFRSRFAGKGRRNKDPEAAAPQQPLTVADTIRTPTARPESVAYFGRACATPELTIAVPQPLKSQALHSHLSRATTQTVATPQSKYASLLKNDAMILGGISMSPTRSGTYAFSGNPSVVNHPSIISMSGSILEASPHNSTMTINPNTPNTPLTQPSAYDAYYTAPLGPLTSAWQQNPYSPSSSGTWERLHAQYPASMPQFSPQHNNFDTSASLREPFHDSIGFKEARQLRQESSRTSMHNAATSDTKSENGKEALEATEDLQGTLVNTTPARQVLRRSVSDYGLRYATDQSDSLDRTPVPKSDVTLRGNTFDVMSPTMPVFNPPKPQSFHRKPVPAPILTPHNARPRRVSDASARSTPTAFHNARPAQVPNPKAQKKPSTLSLRSGTTRGGHPPTPTYPGYQVRSNLEEQMAHQFNVVHHHMEADKHHIGRWIEDAKNYIADRSQPQLHDKFMTQFNQLCVQSNGFRDYLQRIQHQTSNLGPGIVAAMLPGVAADVTTQMAAHEQRIRQDLGQINNNMLALNDNDNAIQRDITTFQRDMKTQLTEMNRKLDMLLQAQGTGSSNTNGVTARQDKEAMQQKLREEARRRQQELLDPAALNAKEQATKAAATTKAPPPPLVSTPPTKTRKATPLPTKQPVMQAALTSTPPHVPQPPGCSKSSGSGSPTRVVRIVDPSIPSPSAVCNAKRVKHGHTRNPQELAKEDTRAGLGVKLEAGVYPALRYQEGTEKVTGKRKVSGKGKGKSDTTGPDENEVLWRRPSGDGEIGGRWYKAAMQQ